MVLFVGQIVVEVGGMEINGGLEIKRGGERGRESKFHLPKMLSFAMLDRYDFKEAPKHKHWVSVAVEKLSRAPKLPP